MRIPSLLAPLLAATLAALASPAAAGLLITVDKSAQRMSVEVNGVERHSWPVSTGKSGYATPAGGYTPFRLEEDHYSKEWDEAPMPHSIFFTKVGHAIHGSFEVKRLGTPASHGCVRLAPENAAKLFALVRAEGLANTKVVLHGVEPVGPPLVAKRNAPGGRQAREEADPMPIAPGNYARVWPDAAAERPALDDYAVRMRRRYLDEQRFYEERRPVRAYEERPYANERPYYYAPRRWYRD